MLCAAAAVRTGPPLLHIITQYGSRLESLQTLLPASHFGLREGPIPKEANSELLVCFRAASDSWILMQMLDGRPSVAEFESGKWNVIDGYPSQNQHTHPVTFLSRKTWESVKPSVALSKERQT